MSRTTNPAGEGNSPAESKKQHPVIAKLSGNGTCSATGFKVTGHAPVLALCRELIAAGLDPDQALEVYRGAILALRVRSIAAGARLTVEDDSRGTPRFRPWRGGAASLVRQNGEADTGYPVGASPLLAGGGK